MGLLLTLVLSGPARAGAPDECHPIPVTWYSPTGIAGCEIYGEGTASMWGGPGAARNDCLYPWRDCQTIAIQSLATGLRIVVTPTMFGDLYTGTSRERIVDLSPRMVAALGLDPAEGLWRVRVTPVDAPVLPDTAL
jgi:hypothetical protein